MSFTSARLVKEYVGTGGKSTWAGLWFGYLPFSLVVNGLRPTVEIFFAYMHACNTLLTRTCSESHGALSTREAI